MKVKLTYIATMATPSISGSVLQSANATFRLVLLKVPIFKCAAKELINNIELPINAAQFQFQLSITKAIQLIGELQCDS